MKKIFLILILLFSTTILRASVYTIGADDFIVDVPSPTIMYSLGFTEMDGVTTPAANKGYLYLKSDGKLYQKNDAGTDYDLTAGVSELDHITQITSTGTMTHAEIETQFTDIATDTDTLQGLIDTLETSTGTLAIRITDLETSTATLEGYITDLWASTSTLEGFIYDLWTSTVSLEDRADNLETSTSTLEGYIYDLLTSTATLDAAVALNTTHRTSDGSDHGFINQDVTTTADVTHSSLTITNTGTFGTITDGDIVITAGNIDMPTGGWIGLGSGTDRLEWNGAEGRIEWYGGAWFDGSDLMGCGNIHTVSGLWTDDIGGETAGTPTISISKTVDITGGLIVSTNVVCAEITASTINAPSGTDYVYVSTSVNITGNIRLDNSYRITFSTSAGGEDYITGLIGGGYLDLYAYGALKARFSRFTQTFWGGTVYASDGNFEVVKNYGFIFDHGDDKDDKIYQVADNTMLFQTHGVTRVEITDSSSTFKVPLHGTTANFSGNVGINEDTPTAQLHIKSNSAPTEYIVKYSSQNDSNIMIITGDGDTIIKSLDIGTSIHDTITVNGTAKEYDLSTHGQNVANTYASYMDRASNTHSPTLFIARARGTHASPSVVANDDILGQIGAGG